MADIQQISIVCGTSTVTLYLIAQETVVNPEYDLTEIYDTEELVLKRADSLITAINIFNLSAGDEPNCLSFIRNKLKVDFNNVNSACKDLYLRFLHEFVLDDHFVIESLRAAYRSTVTLSLKYSSSNYLSGNFPDDLSGDLKGLKEYSKDFKDDDYLFVLVVYFGKLLKALPNNAYLLSTCNTIQILADCDPCIIRDAPTELQELYYLVMSAGTGNDRSVLNVPSDSDDSSSDDSWYSSRIRRNYENNYYKQYHNTYKTIPVETDKEKAARAIDEYYSSDTIIHQYNWHTKWAEFHKKICPDSNNASSDATAEDYLFDFTAFAFDENYENYENSEAGVTNKTNEEEFPAFDYGEAFDYSKAYNNSIYEDSQGPVNNYSDLYDDISVNSHSVPLDESSNDSANDPLDEFTDFMYGYDQYKHVDHSRSTVLYDPEDDMITEHEHLFNQGQAALKEIDRLIASVPETDDINILEQDYSPRSSSWIWELD